MSSNAHPIPRSVLMVKLMNKMALTNNTQMTSSYAEHCAALSIHL